MYCPRLDHFVRFNSNGTIGKCGHMMNAPDFENWESMQSSEWLQQVKQQMASDVWPFECQRCQQTETESNSQSIRLHAIQRDQLLIHLDRDYLILGGVLDNVCNSACQSCNSNLSTKIGSLESRNYPQINNIDLLDRVPLDRVVELDLNGGEPTASPQYRHLLENLPPNVKVVRINTNGSLIIPNIENILKTGIRVIVTLSLDGTGQTHDYVRWPITWKKYTKNVQTYIELRTKYSNLKLDAWTTVHSLNVHDIDNIVYYCKKNDIPHDYAFLVEPTELDATYTNCYTQCAADSISHTGVKKQIAVKENNQLLIDEYISKQDQLRNISIKDYL